MIFSDKETLITRMIKVNINDQTKHINYLSRCPLGIRLEIFEQHKGIFHRLRETYKEEASFGDISYSSLILAVGLIRAKEKALLTKSFGEMTLSEIRDLSSFQAKKFVEKTEKRATKRDKLTGYWPLIRDLKINHRLSFEKISQYLLKKRKFKISSSYIFTCWYELESKETNSLENEL